MEEKRNSEALFALELIKNIKDKVTTLNISELGQIIDISVDMVYDKPMVEEDSAESLLGEHEYPEVEGK